MGIIRKTSKLPEGTTGGAELLSDCEESAELKHGTLGVDM